MNGAGGIRAAVEPRARYKVSLRCPDIAPTLRAYRPVNVLAGTRGLEQHAVGTTLVPFRSLLVTDRLLRQLRGQCQIGGAKDRRGSCRAGHAVHQATPG